MVSKLISYHHLSLSYFYTTYPFCKYALLFSLGVGSCFFPLTLLLLPFFLLPSQMGRLLILFALGALNAYLHTPKAALKVPLPGSALLRIDSSFTSAHPIISKTWLKAHLAALISEEGQTFTGLPVILEKPKGANSLKLGATYFVKKARLSANGRGYYLKLDKQIPPIQVKSASFFTRFKHLCQEKAQRSLSSLTSNRNMRALLLSIILGKPPPALMKTAFQKAGLSHLLCISGFHLILAFSLLLVFFKTCLSHKWASISALVLIAFYALILLPTSSALNRAFLALVLYTFGRYHSCTPNALNLLGSIYFITLLLSPEDLLNIGFQLSYLATFALLWLLPIAKTMLYKAGPSRSLKQVLNLSMPAQIGATVICKIKVLLALNLALDVCTLPLILYHFGSLTWLGFFYNLFAPLLFALLLTLSMVAWLLTLMVPAFSTSAEALLTPLYDLFYRLVLFAPKKLTTPFFLSLPSPLWPLLFLVLLFFSSLYFTLTKEQKNSTISSRIS